MDNKGIVEIYAIAWLKEQGIVDKKTRDIVIGFAKRIEVMMELKDEKN